MRDSYFPCYRLAPATMYLFRVAANNDVGQGPFSDVVGHETVSAVPSAVPEVSGIEPVDRTTLEIRWNVREQIFLC